jgi:hypothetical protein
MYKKLGCEEERKITTTEVKGPISWLYLRIASLTSAGIIVVFQEMSRVVAGPL